MQNPACPFLPEISGIHDFTLTRRHGVLKGADFYCDALCYAQSQWISGKPAQAILQLNKAWMANLWHSPTTPQIPPAPYQALAWILESAASRECGYLGNPIRHFQHLATRVSGPHADIRAWRAWLCYHVARGKLDIRFYPIDGEQRAREGLWIPGAQRAWQEILRQGWPGEAEQAHFILESENVGTKKPGSSK